MSISKKPDFGQSGRDEEELFELRGNKAITS